MSGEAVKALEAEKTLLIERYLKLQDEADAMNERIYDLCCAIEAMNLKIRKAEAADKKAAAKAKAAKASGPAAS